MILILFTASYPYVTGAEQNFVETELQYLSKKFKRIIIVPEHLRTDKANRQLLANVEIEDEYADVLKQYGKISVFITGLFSRLTYIEIIQNPFILFKLTYLKRLIFFSGLANLTCRWIVNWVKKRGLNTGQSLFYTYWFDQAATGIALAKHVLPDIKLVSRAHGYDVYEQRNNPPYWPCRPFTLNYIEYLFPDSDAGTRYLHKRYPEFMSRIETSRLGILDPEIINKPSMDGVFRIVSCSRMVAVKRLDLLLRGITVAAKRKPNQRFEWRHFGEGELRNVLEAQANALPSNVFVNFPGYTTQSDLFNYYRDNPVDIFVNVSESEGTPVAVMEAISCSIPIIATAVGGNKEIVTEQNGILLSENPNPEEISDILLLMSDNSDKKRQGSRLIWQNQYDAHKNFSNFSERLVSIRSF